MSTFAYSSLTSAREAAQPNSSTQPGQTPGMSTYVDALAALVPAEILTAHAVILTFTTKTSSENLGFEIHDAATLAFAFWALLILGGIIYVASRHKAKTWEHLDYARMCIPPAAFVCWTMVQKGTAFDAVARESLTDGMRSAIGIIGAIILGLAASWLAYKADQNAPRPNPPNPPNSPATLGPTAPAGR